jgi:hypothetical protein
MEILSSALYAREFQRLAGGKIEIRELPPILFSQTEKRRNLIHCSGEILQNTSYGDGTAVSEIDRRNQCVWNLTRKRGQSDVVDSFSIFAVVSESQVHIPPIPCWMSLWFSLFNSSSTPISETPIWYLPCKDWFETGTDIGTVYD